MMEKYLRKVIIMHFMHGYGSIWPMIIVFLIWVCLIIIGSYLISLYVHGGHKKTNLDILKERLAKGEIDEKEYERLKLVLKK